MAVQKGIGVVWSVGDITFTGLGTLKLQTLNMDRTAKRKEILDANGDLVGQVFYDKRVAISMNVIPSGTSIALAAAAFESCIPAIGTEVTIADAGSVGSLIESANSGKYSVLSAKAVRTNTGEAAIDMDLETSETNNATAAIT